MSLLDELKSEADERRIAKARSHAVGEREMAEAQARLRPCMAELHEYFKALISHLEVIEPEVSVACEMAEFGRVEGLRPATYRFWTDQPDDPTKFTFGYTAGTRERPRVRLAHAVADKTLTRLHAIGIPCVAGQVGAGHTTLVLTPEVPVLFEFSMALEQRAVRLRIHNHERLGTLEYTYPPAAVTAELTEELGRLVAGKPNRFKTLSGGQMAEESRAEIQRALERDRRRRTAELGGPVSKLAWALGEGVRKLLGKG